MRQLVSGKVVLLNGPSSAGKSTLAREMQARLPEPFWHYSIDHLLAAGILPQDRIRSGEFAWSDLREAFFAGFRQSLPAWVGAGNNLIVEHIIERQEQWLEIRELLRPFDVFVVGVHCPLDELERREQARGDRRVGSAREDFLTTHALCEYDFEVDGMASAGANASAVINAWLLRGFDS